MLPYLNAGDVVEIIAPASRCTHAQLSGLQELLRQWDLRPQVAADIFGDDLLCAHDDAHRLHSLYKALSNPYSKAVLCARGGYGSMRLIPELLKLPKPETPKLFIGLSDITALHLFLMQHWGWPVIHGGITIDKTLPTSIVRLKDLIFAPDKKIIKTDLSPMNQNAAEFAQITAKLTGGNLCLVQTSLATPWQIKAENCILILEEVGERGYKVDRMLAQLEQAGVFSQVKAILLGDFSAGEEADGSSLVEPVLKRFAESCSVPVLRIQGFGHNAHNDPLILGTEILLTTGNTPSIFYKSS